MWNRISSLMHKGISKLKGTVYDICKFMFKRQQFIKKNFPFIYFSETWIYKGDYHIKLNIF